MRYFLLVLAFLVVCPLYAQERIHICLSQSTSVSPETKARLPKRVLNIIQSYPLLPDSVLENNYAATIDIKKPTLSLNGIIINSPELVDKFRNSYDPSPDSRCKTNQ